MALLALVSAKGSPGVTTAALALATVWPRRVILAECDPAGGDVLSGYLAGSQDASRGLLGLTRAERRGDLTQELAGQLLALDEPMTRLLLPGLTDPNQAVGLAPLWDRLATVFMGLEDADPPTDVIADCGRLGTAHFPTPMLRRADLVLLTARSSLTSIAVAQPWVAWMRRDLSATNEDAPALGILLVGAARPYSPREITAALSVPVLAVLAHDPTAADVFSRGAPAGRRFAHSALLRSAREASTTLMSRATERRRHLVPAPVVRNGRQAGSSRVDGAHDL